VETINRQVFEDALKSMEIYGINGMKSPRILANRNIIKESFIRYYESTEEFEKCKYIVGFFEDLEKEIESTNKDKKPSRAKNNSSSQEN
jgi:hypothetical protein